MDKVGLYGAMLLGVLLNVAAQTYIKRGASYDTFTRSWCLLMLLAMGLYGASFLLYGYVLKRVALNVAAPMMSVGTLMMVVLVSYLCFDEPLSAKQLIGLALGVVAIVLMLT